MVKAVEKAYDVIRSGIVDGRYPSGYRLTEQEIAELSGVSRTPVREALRRLSSEGLLSYVPNQGAMVASWTDEEVEEVFVLRAMLEAFAVERAARRMTENDIAELRELAEEMIEEAEEGKAGHLQRIKDLNTRFHKKFYVSTRSPRLQGMISTLIDVPLVSRTFGKYSREDLLRSTRHHLEIVTALEAGDDAWAASVMRSHILAAYSVFKGR